MLVSGCLDGLHNNLERRGCSLGPLVGDHLVDPAVSNEPDRRMSVLPFERPDLEQLAA